jgi:hypothetical protein
VLGHRNGFYGLIAEGWNITDFGTPWLRGPLPSDLDPSEYIVGLLDAERTSGAVWDADAFNARIADHHATWATQPTAWLDEAVLARLRATVRQLHEQWRALPGDETLALTFPADEAG